MPVPGDALDAASFRPEVPPACTFVHMAGVAKPNPAKRALFREIDQVSFDASLDAAMATHVSHFIYISVAQPAPVMKSYIEVRKSCESRLRSSGLRATILRPWYVLGPGHWWPYVLLPFYALAERVGPWSAGARRLGLVTRAQMTSAIVWAVQHPAEDWRVIDVPGIRACANLSRGSIAGSSARTLSEPAH
jgi:uncharacterized protein YbjT (DUF2867 family)